MSRVGRVWWGEGQGRERGECGEEGGGRGDREERRECESGGESVVGGGTREGEGRVW